MTIHDPANVPLSAFDDEDLHHLVMAARADPTPDPQWLADVEAEYADRFAD